MLSVSVVFQSIVVQMAELVEGRERHPAVEVMVTTSRFVRDLVQKAPYWPELERFGVRVMVDSCILHMPVLRPEARVLMTNSGKYAYYIPGLLGRQVAFGSLVDCVRSAVLGRVYRSEELWGGGDGATGRPGDARRGAGVVGGRGPGDAETRRRGDAEKKWDGQDR